MIEFGIGFLCGMAVVIVVWVMRSPQVETANKEKEPGCMKALKITPATRPDNRRAREARTIKRINEMEESITKGAPEYYG